MPSAAQNTYSNNYLVPMYDADEALCQPVNLPASVTYAKGTVLGEVTATPGLFKAYASGSSDGSQVPKAILQYDCATDSSSNITIGAAAGGAAFGVTAKSVPAYFSGYFKTAELVQSGAGAIDANALSAANWHLISGSVADGVVFIG